MTEVQELVARLRLKDEMTGPIRKVRAGISGVSDALNSPRMRQGINQLGTGLRNATRIAAVGIAALTTQVAAGLNQLVQLEDLSAQTNAAIKSTGGVAGITAEQVRALAEEYEGLNAVIDDKVIQSGENLLLTFTNIRKKAFQPALEAALDMSVALDQDLNTSVLQLGKALNDPIRGLTALRRVGVQFTKSQEDQIKALVETGDLLGAQQVILEELGKEFGGRFAAQGKTAKGTIAGIGDAVEDLQKSLATALFPAIQKVLPRLRELLASPEVTKGAKDLGEAIAGLFSDENIAAGADILKSAISTAREAAPIVRDAAKATFSIVSAAVSLFRSLPPEIQKLAIGAFAVNKLTGGLVTNLAGGLISAVLKQLVSGVVNVQGAVVNVVGGGGPGVPLATPPGSPTGLVGQITNALKAVLPALTFSQVVGGEVRAEFDPKLEAALARLPHNIREASSNVATATGDSAKLQVAATERAEARQTTAFRSLSASQRSAVISAGNVTKAATDSVRAAIFGQTSAIRTGASNTVAAVRNKRLSVTVPVNITTKITVRDQVAKTTYTNKYGAVAS